MFIFQQSEKKQVHLIKKSKCFSYKKMRYITYNYFKKNTIISEVISDNSNS